MMTRGELFRVIWFPFFLKIFVFIAIFTVLHDLDAPRWMFFAVMLVYVSFQMVASLYHLYRLKQEDAS